MVIGQKMADFFGKIKKLMSNKGGGLVTSDVDDNHLLFFARKCYRQKKKENKCEKCSFLGSEMSWVF